MDKRLLAKQSLVVWIVYSPAHLKWNEISRNLLKYVNKSTNGSIILIFFQPAEAVLLLCKGDKRNLQSSSPDTNAVPKFKSDLVFFPCSCTFLKHRRLWVWAAAVESECSSSSDFFQGRACCGPNTAIRSLCAARSIAKGRDAWCPLGLFNL